MVFLSEEFAEKVSDSVSAVHFLFVASVLFYYEVFKRKN